MNESAETKTLWTTPPGLTQIVEPEHEKNLLAWIKRWVHEDLLAEYEHYRDTFESNMHFAPVIPEKKLANARKMLELPDSEDVLVLIDCTVFGSAKDCMVWGRQGLYNRPKESVPPVFIHFDEFLTADIRFDGASISIGDTPNFVPGAFPLVPMLELLRRLQSGLRDGVSLDQVNSDAKAELEITDGPVGSGLETADQPASHEAGESDWYFDWKGAILGLMLAGFFYVGAFMRSMQRDPEYPALIVLAFVVAALIFGIKKRKR